MSTTLTLTPTGNPEKFRYVHMKLSDFKSYPYWGNEEMVKQALIMNDNVSEIVAAELKNHQLVIEDIAFNSEYVLFMIAVDTDGNPSSTITRRNTPVRSLLTCEKTETRIYGMPVCRK